MIFGSIFSQSTTMPSSTSGATIWKVSRTNLTRLRNKIRISEHSPSKKLRRSRSPDSTRATPNKYSESAYHLVAEFPPSTLIEQYSRKSSRNETWFECFLQVRKLFWYPPVCSASLMKLNKKGHCRYWEEVILPLIELHDWKLFLGYLSMQWCCLLIKQFIKRIKLQPLTQLPATRVQEDIGVVLLRVYT